MPKGYWIAQIDVHDRDGHKAYTDINGIALKKYGARVVVRGGTHEVKEGRGRARTVVFEFDSYETALACYNSPEYQEAVAIRSKTSVADFIVIEGYDGPQPYV